MKKKQKKTFGCHAPSRYILSQLPDCLQTTVNFEPNRAKQRAYQQTVDDWGARRRAMLSDIEAREGMTEIRKLKETDLSYFEDFDLGWGKDPRGLL